MTEFLSDNQKQDIFFFNENLSKWAADPLLKRKYVVISDQKIQGFFDTFETALGDAVTKFQPKNFVIQQIITRDEIVNYLSPALV